MIIISVRRQDLVIVYKKKRTYRKEDAHRLKVKEREKKKDKYLDIPKKLKIWNMKVTVIPIVISAIGTVIK